MTWLTVLMMLQMILTAKATAEILPEITAMNLSETTDADLILFSRIRVKGGTATFYAVEYIQYIMRRRYHVKS